MEKKLGFQVTRAIQDRISQSELMKHALILEREFQKHKRSHFKFGRDGYITACGVNFNRDEHTEDEEVIIETPEYISREFWCRFEEQGDRYIGTFLLPAEF